MSLLVKISAVCRDVSTLHYDPSREEHAAFETKTTEIKERYVYVIYKWSADMFLDCKTIYYVAPNLCVLTKFSSCPKPLLFKHFSNKGNLLIFELLTPE